MRVLVAGATGDVGLPLVRRLLTAGHEVVAMSRGGRAETETRRGARIVVADALDRDAVRRSVHDAAPDAVADLLTALPRNGPTRPSHLEPTNRLRRVGSANLLEAAREAGVRRHVAESVVFVYGYGDRGPDPLTEEDAPGTSRLSPALEAPLEKERRTVDAGGVAARFGLFYGPGVGSTDYLVRMLRRRMMGLPGGGRGWNSWIHVEDAAAFVHLALESDVSGEVFNVVDDEPTTWRAFVEELASATRAPRPYGIPVWLARPFFPYPAMFMSSSKLRVSNEKAKRELGWKPSFPTYREGLAHVAAVGRTPAQRE